MNKNVLCFLVVFSLLFSCAAIAQKSSSSEPVLPYSPSLDLTSMDKSVDPCFDFYHYSCGAWQKRNPIPPDQTSWSVYGKLFEDNLKFLRGMLEQAAKPSSQRTAVEQKTGDFYAACVNEAVVEKQGLSPVQPELDAIAKIKSVKDLTPLVARLQFTYRQYSYNSPMLFAAGSNQDPDNSEQVIADVDQGGLGLPDRDYYTKTDAKSKETRDRYLQHVQKVLELAGDSPEVAKKNAETILRMETALAQASMTRVDRRDPHKLVHKMKVADLAQLAPNFDWATYYRELEYPQFDILNVFPFPRGRYLVPVSVVEILGREFRVLSQVFAWGQGNAASLEALRAIYRLQPWRSAGAGVCGQSFFARAQAEHARHGATD